ncbi:hypothetical protein [Marinomonas profundimaris]|uniref:hypothetical protein n=1 Tax=Marinomonas profundimaris TaxID=1208321 RepID=UPI00126920F8|nr:hypothetical protein [Marinomonas profundimaris]
MKILIPLVLVMTLVGCTTKDIYSNLQYNHARSCDRLKSTQSDDCRSQYNDSFEDYTQKREGTLDK